MPVPLGVPGQENPAWRIQEALHTERSDQLVRELVFQVLLCLRIAECMPIWATEERDD